MLRLLFFFNITQVLLLFPKAKVPPCIISSLQGCNFCLLVFVVFECMPLVRRLVFVCMYTLLISTISSFRPLMNFITFISDGYSDPGINSVDIVWLMFILYIWSCEFRLGLHNEMQNFIYCLNISQSEANWSSLLFPPFYCSALWSPFFFIVARLGKLFLAVPRMGGMCISIFTYASQLLCKTAFVFWLMLGIPSCSDDHLLELE